jgi:hypothetical protein
MNPVSSSRRRLSYLGWDGSLHWHQLSFALEGCMYET